MLFRSGQSSNHCTIDVSRIRRNATRRAQSLYCAAAIKDGAMRFAYLLRPTRWRCVARDPPRVRWLLDRPVKPGDDTQQVLGLCYRDGRIQCGTEVVLLLVDAARTGRPTPPRGNARLEPKIHLLRLIRSNRSLRASRRGGAGPPFQAGIKIGNVRARPICHGPHRNVIRL